MWTVPPYGQPYGLTHRAWITLRVNHTAHSHGYSQTITTTTIKNEYKKWLTFLSALVAQYFPGEWLTILLTIAITWAFMFSIFLYLLPVRKVYLIPYILAFTALTGGVAITMSNFGLFAYTTQINQYIGLTATLAWLIVTAWAFVTNEKVELK